MTPGREHLEDILQSLHDDLIKMVSKVEENIKSSLLVLKEQDLALGQQVIDSDKEINAMELAIEEKCVKLIATQQPAAKDLREIITTLKVITELERIGDYATDISKMVKRFPRELKTGGLDQLIKMSEEVLDFLSAAIDCFISKDDLQALKLSVLDDQIDASYKKALIWAMEHMRDNGNDANEVLDLIFINKYLERIADRATNICEWAIYLSTGERKELQ